MRRGCLYIVLLLVSNYGVAQVEGPCADSLAKANTQFEFGRFYQVPKILKGCIERGFSNEQKIQAHYLLTRNYIYLDNTKKAEENYLSLLKIDPEYRVNEQIDPIELVFLSRNFVTTPLVSFNIKGGTNFSTIDVINNRSTGNVNNTDEYYDLMWGFQIGAGAELHFTNNISLGGNLNTSYKQYGHREHLFKGTVTTENGSVAVVDESKYVMEQIWIDVPVFLKYTVDFPFLRPYLLAGYQFNYLANARSKNNQLINFEPVNDNTEFSQTIVSDPPYNANILFNNFNQSLFFGIGAMYRVNYNFIFIEFGYSPGLKNMTDQENTFPKSDNRYDFPGNFQYGIVQDDLRLNSFKLNLGYIIPKYYPRKKGKKTIRNLFEKNDE